jgi:hypothetical protein
MQTYKLLEQDSVLLSQPLLIEHFGRAGAQFLSQLHYWLEHSQCGQQHLGQKWIYNTENSWANQLKLSARQFRRHVSNLADKGIIFVQKLNPHKSNRTNYFSINYELLNQFLAKDSSSSSLSSEVRSFVHEDIMSLSSCHNVPIYIETKTTNKDINKSEVTPIERVGRGRTKNKPVDPVKQVNTINSKDMEKKEETEVGLVTPQTSLVTENLKTEAIQLKKKTTTTQDMLEIWNTTLGEKAHASMSKDLAPLLVSAFHKKFEQSLDLWKSYCELIKTSPYLMGEHFQLSIFWGLKFSAIDRLRSGELGVKPNAINHSIGQGGTPAVTENQVAQMIEKLPESTEAKTTRLQIARAIGAAAYHSWFHQATFVTREGGLQIVAPNTFVERYWETHYSWINKSKNSIKLEI